MEASQRSNPYGQYEAVPPLSNPEHIRRGYGGSPTNAMIDRRDFQADGAAGTSIVPSRSGTLKKGGSVSRKSSIGRSNSRRSARTESVKSLNIGHGEKFLVGDEENMHSVYYTPVPTTGTPTDVLANRFQAWRKVLKDLVAYYREIQASYEMRSKSLLKVSNVIGNTIVPAVFIPEGAGGIADATQILRDMHKKSASESNKAREIEEDVIISLLGLRADLHQKIKEIRNLSGDFKNSVVKEMEATRRAVHVLRDAIEQVDTQPSAVTGKGDPFLVKLSVEKQLEKQIDEENYLHRAYLNLEGSGRELESIVVGEIQKSYNALAGILRRDADDAYEAIDRLRSGPIAMARDHEWDTFVENDPRFVDPNIPLRTVHSIEYPGKYHPAAAEVRAGMLERKSKYLKSYTPGWYVLSPTHLHEFKSPDRLHLQSPGMSLYLLDQKLGSHSQPGSSSHKFILKGRQTGGVHRGHSWVFRAESHDTMMAWYDAIRNLTQKTGEERNAFVRQHARSISAVSQTAASVDSDGALDEDEADAVPYSANPSTMDGTTPKKPVERPQPGGRFPSDLQLGRSSRSARSPSSASSEHERGVPGAVAGQDRTAHEHVEQAPQQHVPPQSLSGNVNSPPQAIQAPAPLSRDLAGADTARTTNPGVGAESPAALPELGIDNSTVTPLGPTQNPLAAVNRPSQLPREGMPDYVNSQPAGAAPQHQIPATNYEVPLDVSTAHNPPYQGEHVTSSGTSASPPITSRQLSHYDTVVAEYSQPEPAPAHNTSNNPGQTSPAADFAAPGSDGSAQPKAFREPAATDDDIAHASGQAAEQKHHGGIGGFGLLARLHGKRPHHATQPDQTPAQQPTESSATPGQRQDPTPAADGYVNNSTLASPASPSVATTTTAITGPSRADDDDAMDKDRREQNAEISLPVITSGGSRDRANNEPLQMGSAGSGRLQGKDDAGDVGEDKVLTEKVVTTEVVTRRTVEVFHPATDTAGA